MRAQFEQCVHPSGDAKQKIMALVSDEMRNAVRRAVDALQKLDRFTFGFRRKYGFDQVYAHMFRWTSASQTLFETAVTVSRGDADINVNAFSTNEPPGRFKVHIVYRAQLTPCEIDANRRVVRRLRNELKRLTNNMYPVLVTDQVNPSP